MPARHHHDRDRLTATLAQAVAELNDHLGPDVTLRATLVRGSQVSIDNRGRRRGRLHARVGRRELDRAPQIVRWRLAVQTAKAREGRPQNGAVSRVLTWVGMGLVLLPLVAEAVGLFLPASRVAIAANALIYGFGSVDKTAVIGGFTVAVGLALGRFGFWEYSKRAEQTAAEWGIPTPESVRTRFLTGTALHPRRVGAIAAVAVVVAGGAAGWFGTDAVATAVVTLQGYPGGTVYMFASRTPFHVMGALFTAVMAEALIHLGWQAAHRIAKGRPGDDALQHRADRIDHRQRGDHPHR